MMVGFRSIMSGHIWKHTRTQNLYAVMCIAIHSETEESLVVYRAKNSASETVWVRPLREWYEKFEWESYENGSATR